MSDYNAEDVRTVALVGHAGDGKTPLLAATGAIPQPVRVDRGTTVCDFTPLEEEPMHSLDPGIVSSISAGKHVNLIDTPRFPDFLGKDAFLGMNTMNREERDPLQGFSPAGQLLHLITGYWISQAIHVAAELGIADLLDKQGRAIEDLARETGAVTDALYRILRALAASGVFAEVAPHRFALTPMGALLKRDMPGNLRDFSRFQGTGWHWQAWGTLIDSVRSGRPGRLAPNPGCETAENYFDYLAGNAESAAIFNSAMTGYTTQVHAAVVETYDFGSAQAIMDVGGGQGALLAAILEEYPRLRGVLFDRESVIAGAHEMFAQFGVAERAQAVGGDFFVAVPQGADITILCAVIHDWDAEHAAAILRRVVEAMPLDGRVLIVENVIPEDNEAHPGKLIDIEMLLITGGRERTQREFTDLLASAGLGVERVLSTAVSVSIIDARRL